MDLQEITQIGQAWDRIAVGYDRYVTPTSNWALPKAALSHVGLMPGMRVLDVASGSGALSLPAARLGAEVLAVDISPRMIERLKDRAIEEVLPNLEGRVMDGHRLELEDNTFDIAGSQFGVMLFPDLPVALREMVRVVKPGGSVLVVAYGPPTHVEFLGFFIRAMQSAVPGFTGLPSDPPPLPFQLADPAVLRQRMADAGLREILIEKAKEWLGFDSGDDMWNWVVNSNPVAMEMIADLTNTQKTRVREALDTLLQERAKGDAKAILKADVNIGIGIK